MPQLEISTYITQVFWLLVTFMSFWFVMDKVIIPKISEKIEMRKRKYDDFIQKAEEINSKALDSLKHYEERLAVAKKNASEQVAQNEQELKRIIAEQEEKINQQLKQKIAEKEEILAKEKAEVMAELDKISRDTAYQLLQEMNISSITRADIEEVSLGDNAA